MALQMGQSEMSLSGHPIFAYEDSILGRVYETYDFLLEILGWHPAEPGAAEAESSKFSADFIFDTVNRCHLDALLRSLGSRDTRSREKEIQALKEAYSVSPGKLLSAESDMAGCELSSVVDDQIIDLIAEPSLPAPGHCLLRQLYAQYLSAGHGRDRLTRMDSDDADAVSAATTLLREVLPELTPGLLRHVRYLAKITGPEAAESVSTREISGTVFVSARCFEAPERLAEALLHEAVHQRFYDLMLTRSIFVPTYDTASAPTVAPEWHVDSPVKDWPADRALAAAHVYVHLTVWFQQLQYYGGISAQRREAAARSAYVAAWRARSLLDKIEAIAPGQLGPAGLPFLAWLRSEHFRMTASVSAVGRCFR